MKRGRRSKREPAPVEGARWVPLTKGKFALVSEIDYNAVMSVGPWHLYTPSRGAGKRRRCTHYARKVFYVPGEPRRSVYLHRWLWVAGWGKDPIAHVDHVDGDGLDCRREKLRAATQAQNQHNRRVRNKTTFVGVSPSGRRFVARIIVDGKRETLGTYDTAEDAARAYDARARATRGEFARCNFEAPPC